MPEVVSHYWVEYPAQNTDFRIMIHHHAVTFAVVLGGLLVCYSPWDLPLPHGGLFVQAAHAQADGATGESVTDRERRRFIVRRGDDEWRLREALGDYLWAQERGEGATLVLVGLNNEQSGLLLQLVDSESWRHHATFGGGPVIWLIHYALQRDLDDPADRELMRSRIRRELSATSTLISLLVGVSINPTRTAEDRAVASQQAARATRHAGLLQQFMETLE